MQHRGSMCERDEAMGVEKESHDVSTATVRQQEGAAPGVFTCVAKSCRKAHTLARARCKWASVALGPALDYPVPVVHEKR